MQPTSDAYVLSSADASAIETAASDLTASGQADGVLTLTSAEASALVSEIYSAAHSAFEAETQWTSGYSNPGTLEYPQLAALYGALGGTDTWTLTGSTS